MPPKDENENGTQPVNVIGDDEGEDVSHVIEDDIDDEVDEEIIAFTKRISTGEAVQKQPRTDGLPIRSLLNNPNIPSNNGSTVRAPC